ncbi:SnoaL-like domain-containing protein [Cognatiyoonia koreensis]|uniref:SnoaL-like domain-containing protein n=1 Tax=Cognatiyoonia koreensis TaxID=364200 RepID=A0A1I0QLY5_9RHOB|nr:nuclear transport factor 2 family protein [Cognatiyoonia koreensis]SEW28127.1 SnoaL-like domain-containing protein [Cognatiyoonia koreensis]
MSDPIETFFDAWGMSDDAARADAIASVYADGGTYTDPRSPDTLSGAAIAEYVNMFSANAPGWSAKVVKSDSIGGVIRTTVAFGGKGPDGSDMVQHGQYFADLADGKITRMVGFVGTGAPE